MNEELLEQVHWQLTDVRDNLEVPEGFDGCLDQYRRDWLLAVAKTAAEMAEEIKL